jgi:hypothetical protein
MSDPTLDDCGVLVRRCEDCDRRAPQAEQDSDEPYLCPDCTAEEREVEARLARAWSHARTRRQP